MLCHPYCDITHDFAPGINLKNFRPPQWSTVIDCLKSLCDLRRSFLRWEVRQPWICLQQLSMRTYRLSATLRSPFHEDGKEDHFWTFKLKRWSRDMLRSQQIYLPDGLFHQPKLWVLCNVLRNSGFFSQFLHSWQSLPKAFRTIINPWKFSFHFIIVHRKRLAANPKAKVFPPT